VDGHAKSGRSAHPALVWCEDEGRSLTLCYGELMDQSSRFANLLSDLSINAAEVVAVYTGRIPAMVVAALGIWKRRCVFCPLFSALGPEPIFHRLHASRAVALVTTRRLYHQHVEGLRQRLPHLRHVLIADAQLPAENGLLDLPRRLCDASPSYVIAPTDWQDPASLHFTSGTTGLPKGAVHVHAAALSLYETGSRVFNFQPDDIFWCTADPGWVTGTSYGILAPLLHGITHVVDAQEFDLTRWYRILQEQRVTVWYTSPSAIRRLMRQTGLARRQFDLSRLRLVASVGEPLHPEAIRWAEKALGLPIVDTWWQTETGAIMISSTAAPEIRPGSMGWPLPGIQAAVVERGQGQTFRLVEEPDTVGELALMAGWPSMFRGYLDDPEATAKCFMDSWYLTGDLVRRDRDGYFWFVGRADDIIKTAGHLVSPFEVESALLSHPAVFEAAATVC
jgi:acetyl-CoA synthetase